MNGPLKNILEIIHLYIAQNVNRQHGIGEVILQEQCLVVRLSTGIIKRSSSSNKKKK